MFALLSFSFSFEEHSGQDIVPKQGDGTAFCSNDGGVGYILESSNKMKNKEDQKISYTYKKSNEINMAMKNSVHSLWLCKTDTIY